MTESSYTAWDDNLYEWPPPDGWYEASDGKWWPEGYGPNVEAGRAGEAEIADTTETEIDEIAPAVFNEPGATAVFPAGGDLNDQISAEERADAEHQRPVYDELPPIDDVFGGKDPFSEDSFTADEVIGDESDEIQSAPAPSALNQPVQAQPAADSEPDQVAGQGALPQKDQSLLDLEGESDAELMRELDGIEAELQDAQGEIEADSGFDAHLPALDAQVNPVLDEALDVAGSIDPDTADEFPVGAQPSSAGLFDDAGPEEAEDLLAAAFDPDAGEIVEDGLPSSVPLEPLMDAPPIIGHDDQSQPDGPVAPFQDPAPVSAAGVDQFDATSLIEQPQPAVVGEGYGQNHVTPEGGHIQAPVSPVFGGEGFSNVDQAEGPRRAMPGPEAPRTIWPLVLIGIIAAVIALLVIAYLVFRDAGDADAGAGDVDPAPAVGLGSIAQPYDFGTGVVVFYDTDGDQRRWVVQVLSPVADGTEEFAALPEGVAPIEGEILAFSRVRVTYQSGPAPGRLVDLRLNAVGTSSTWYSFEDDRCAAASDQLVFDAELQPSESVEGNLCWEVSAGDLDELKLAIEAGPADGTVHLSLN